VSAAATFIPDPGTNFTVGNESAIAARTAELAAYLGINIYGISGYRTPAHSVAVGGFADDPHTEGDAEDVGVGSQLRSSAAQVPESVLAQFGLYRPFDPTDDPSNSEVNHWQLLPGTGTGDTVSTAPSPSSSSTSTTPSSSSSSSGGVLGSGIGPNVGPDLNPVDLANKFVAYLERSLLKAALYAVLVIGGIGLAVYGLTRTFKPREATNA
jgi:hypothetical protein